MERNFIFKSWKQDLIMIQFNSIGIFLCGVKSGKTRQKNHIWRQTMSVLLVFTTIENIFKLNVLLIEFDWIELV